MNSVPIISNWQTVICFNCFVLKSELRNIDCGGLPLGQNKRDKSCDQIFPRTKKEDLTYMFKFKYFWVLETGWRPKVLSYGIRSRIFSPFPAVGDKESNIIVQVMT